MKKIFTLISVAFIALSMNAQTKEDVSSRFTGLWNAAESTSIEDGVIVYQTAAWGGLSAWLGNEDWSAWDKIVFEFAEPTTVNTQLVIQHATEGAAADNAWGNAGITSLSADLGEKATDIKQVALQASDAVTLKITAIYLLKEAPTSSSALWEGECVFGNWGNGFSVGADKFASAVEGDQLEFVYTVNVNEEKPWYQFKTIFSGTEDTLTSNASDLNEYSCASVQATSTSYKITLNAADITRLKETGLYTNGKDLTVTQVNLIHTIATGIQAVKTLKIDNVRYNLAGQQVDASYKGVVIQNGKKMIQK